MLTKIDGAAMDAETVQMLSMIDEEKDANIIISPEGLIQFANKGVTNVRSSFKWATSHFCCTGTTSTHVKLHTAADESNAGCKNFT